MRYILVSEIGTTVTFRMCKQVKEILHDRDSNNYDVSN
jgi:hypothetical protein